MEKPLIECDTLNGPAKLCGKPVKINEIEYLYSISKSEDNELSIVFFESIPKSNITFSYKATLLKLTQDIKILSLCENIDEMISSLNKVFNSGNIKVDEKNGKYYLEMEFGGIISKKTVIELTKTEPEVPMSQLEERIIFLENNYKILSNKIEKLEKDKNIDITETIKDILKEKEVKLNLFQEMEKLLLSKYKLIPKFKETEKTDESEEREEREEKVIIKIVDDKIKEIEKNKMNDIENVQKIINENLKEINGIKQKINKKENNSIDNYIIFKVAINGENKNKDIRLFNQSSIYKNYNNFEIGDIEIMIDEKPIPIKYKYHTNFEYDKESKNCEKSQRIEYNLFQNFEFYWNFEKGGIYTIKIIFKKKLYKSNNLFSGCRDIIEIDCSNFDCSQITDCSFMFYECIKLKILNLGKLNFSLSTHFNSMFSDCKKLEILDVSNFDTKNAETFKFMFYNCERLKEINVSKFITSKCKEISSMFQYCKSLTSIDMLNWDMKSIEYSQKYYGLYKLFNECTNLKYIKMNLNFSNPKQLLNVDIFGGLPKNG